MLEFLSSLPEFDDDEVSNQLWNILRELFHDSDGICYYRHPVLGARSGVTADLSLLTRSHSPTAIHGLNYQLDEVHSINHEFWIVRDDVRIDSPLLQIDDFVTALESLINADRRLRRRVVPKGILALPLITQLEFESKFNVSASDFNCPIFWQGSDLAKLISRLPDELSNPEWEAFRAVVQGATPLRRFKGETESPSSNTLSSAIRELERKIKLLDRDQERVAIQIPPGPQRIRGLAGTGKTVLLAMRVANIHRHYPERRILFTFNTRSLYNQSRRLIAQFYAVHQSGGPDWSKIHIRHAWGGRSSAGVYSDICARNGVEPLTFRTAKKINRQNPFQACCTHVLEQRILPHYDFVIVDEAQDFPPDFFKALYRLSRDSHCVYWAYDQLQSLAESNLAIPGPDELFGLDERGAPFVEFDDQDYAGRIPKDLVLNKSYRCPRKVLMLAHAIGLGLYNSHGCVQMLTHRESWQAIGYEIEGDAEWQTSDRVIVSRPISNSPVRICDVYNGEKSLIKYECFSNRDEEFDWVASSINEDVNVENVPPEQIAIVVLDALSIKDYAARMQRRLVDANVASVIPGLLHDADAYQEEGRVTISSVFRAKGNEAYVVYVVGFESLYNYVDAISNRNRAFTAISRSKAWVRISGVGSGMRRAADEIERILADIPKFRFEFPDMENLRKLDAVTRQRRRKRMLSDDTIEQFLQDPEMLDAASPELFERLKKLVMARSDESQ